jgi:hypothetical protein
LQDKEVEAQVCIAQGEAEEAARLYEDLNQWELALKYYEQASSLDGSVRALAGLGRFEEAGQKLSESHRYVVAARQYQRAADQVMEQYTLDRTAAADCLRKAAENYAFGGKKMEAEACHQAAARVLSAPVIYLDEVKLGSALIVGQESRLQICIGNRGYGPAREVRVSIDGRGFGYDTPTSIGNAIDVLASHDTAAVQAGLTPVTAGSGVELRLSVTFKPLRSTDIDQTPEKKVGPFQAFLSVKQPAQSQPASIHIGSFEYIGPGGVHAQDVVKIRPNYHVGDQPRSLSVVEGIQDSVSHLPLVSGNADSSYRVARFCSQCGKSIEPGQTRCSNPACGVRLCIRCGTYLNDQEMQCPNCKTHLSSQSNHTGASQ